MREKKRLDSLLATESELARRSSDITAYFDLAREGEDVSKELRREVDDLRGLVEKLETETLLSGENDERSAIVTIHPWRRRHRVAGLGRDADADVSEVGGAPGFLDAAL